MRINSKKVIRALRSRFDMQWSGDEKNKQNKKTKIEKNRLPWNRNLEKVR